MAHDDGQVCLCVADHRPKVVELHEHHILPLYLGGADEPNNRVWICPNTHAATHELLRLYLKGGGKPAAGVVDDYPVMARALAADGWARYKARQVG
jgi:hypothetical protein